MTSRFKRADVLVVTENEELHTAFRRVPGLMNRPVRIFRYPSLVHPGVLDAPTPWAVIFLDMALLHREEVETWSPVLRRLFRRYPRTKWVACGSTMTKLHLLPRWLRFHRTLTPPWTPETLAQVLKELLLPHAEVQAALALSTALPPRPEWLDADVVRERLVEVKSRLALRGMGWYDFRVGPLMWMGDLWPETFRPHPPSPGEAPLARYAWWDDDLGSYWFYALPVFQETWLAAWGATPFPHRLLPEALSALRDAFQHMEPPTRAEPPPDHTLPDLKPLFDDVPPPFPNS